MISNRYRQKAVTDRVHGLFFLLLLTLLPACGTPRFSEIRETIGAQGQYIEGVPFYRQAGHACGPAALAAVLAFWGSPADLDELTRAVVVPKLRGTLPMDMDRAMRERGFRTTTAHGDRTLLFGSVRRGAPVICLLDLGFSVFRQPHYVTVIGFDEVRRLFILHDGVTQDRTMSYEQFDRYWSRGGSWMLVAEPDSR